MVSLMDYRGQVVLLNIWATWCPPCVDEMPSLEKLHQSLKNKNFEILAVSIDSSGAETVSLLMEKHKLSFPALIDAAGSLKKLYQTTGVLESFIIDKTGRMVGKLIGPRDWAVPEAVQYFETLIQGAGGQK